jgi:DNA-binding CsgD family transcriptional regulator
MPEVLQRKCEGLTNAQIGQRLGLTARQVEHVLRRHRKHSGQ